MELRQLYAAREAAISEINKEALRILKRSYSNKKNAFDYRFYQSNVFKVIVRDIASKHKVKASHLFTIAGWTNKN